MASVTMEEYDLMKDSKYRMYVAAVDKALKNFDYTSEWADLIAALGKLNKVLASYTKFPVIPRRIKISKRLAQCMHPALPSGVHLKALETYDIIFRCMGTNRLSCDLFIYSAGLFPLMGHAAMNIRPTLLTIYETHFVPLRDRLSPALSGFLSGILPGLDTGSDHFERTVLLLENVCEGVGPPNFYTCMWQCVANNSPVRLHAVGYVLAHYSRKLPMEDQLYLMGYDVGLMVCGLCAAVQDSSVLVQRSALDLLMCCFPMNNRQLLYADMVMLVTAALSTILRRDMSLNRRLYSWLLETDINNSEENPANKPQSLSYDLLHDAIKNILKKCSCELQLDIKPYRLLTSLFDKPQIGSVILDSVLYDVFRTLYLSCLHQQKYNRTSGSGARCVSFNGDLNSLKHGNDDILQKQFVSKNCQELVKNANLLFNTLQSYYIWSYIEKLYGEAVESLTSCKHRERCHVNEIGSGAPSVLELCILTDFLLDIIPIESYAESTSNILPSLFKKIITCLQVHIVDVNQLEITESLRLCTRILSKIQPISLEEEEKKHASGNHNNIKQAVFELDKTVVAEQRMRTLEKSKSDSRINENVDRNELLVIEESSRERSYSNQMLIKKKPEKISPRVEKKPNVSPRVKTKKSKSSSIQDLKKTVGETDEALEDSLSDSPEAVPLIKPQPVSVATTTTTTTSKLENKHFLNCLEEYKRFYTSFVCSKILPQLDVNAVFQELICDRNAERIHHLHNLLHQRLYDEVPPAQLVKQRSVVVGVAKENAHCAYETAMGVASNILLEFSAFPTENPLPKSLISLPPPDWLQVLIVVACSNQSSRAMQIVAMSTLLEVFSLAMSSQGGSSSGKVEANTEIVIGGILTRDCVEFVQENTVVMEEMSQILWELLGVLSNQKQLMACVTLLYQIHNIFDTKPFVEHVINMDLSSDAITVNKIKQFCLLWHLGRDLNIKLSPNKSSTRNFDRSLLKILDNLQNAHEPNMQLLTEAFLAHGLMHNDLPRLINPILSKLLVGTTARVSIKKINFHDGDAQSDANYDHYYNIQKAVDDVHTKKVYAVSNINGNIMYHVTDNEHNNNSVKPATANKKKWFAFSSKGGGKKYASNVAISTTTSIGEDNGVVTTKKNKDYKGGLTTSPKSPKLPTTSKLANNNVKLIINPLSSKEVYPNGLDGSYSKLESHSSTESLDSTTPEFPRNFHHNSDRDSGYDSLRNKSHPELSIAGVEPPPLAVKPMCKSRSFDEKIGNVRMEEESSLVQSWTYCMSDSANLANGELELSKSAEDFFRMDVQGAVMDILNEILDKVCMDLDQGPLRPVNLDLRSTSCGSSNHLVLYPIHSHICIYEELFDSNQILYALQTLKTCLSCNPQLFIKSLATSGLKDLQNSDILTSLARHRKSLLGNAFQGELTAEHINFYRGWMFLDVVMSVCLDYARSFHFPLDEPEVITNNLKIQLASVEILDVLVQNLVAMVQESAKGFASYIGDMLGKCKLQRTLLHCLLTSVRHFDEDMTLAEKILRLNGFVLCGGRRRVGKHVEAFQIQMLRLIQSLIVLEHTVFPNVAPSATSATAPNSTPQDTTTSPAATSTGDLNYTPMVLIPQQQMFLSAIMSALRNNCMRSLHEKWLNMVTCCLPYFGENLKQISISVIHQLCNNIVDIAGKYRSVNSEDDDDRLVADYAVTQLEALTILCHYCLLDASQTVNQNVPAAQTTQLMTSSGDILNNLVNVFFSPLTSSETGGNSKQNSGHYQNARKTILSHMPFIISNVAKLWQTVVCLDGNNTDYNVVYGNAKVVKQQLLEFLSPIAVNHGGNFLAAIAVAWYERRNPFSGAKTVLPEPNAGQQNLVELISAIRVIPLDNLVQTVITVIKNPPPIEGLTGDICLDVAVLELFYCYMRNASTTQLSEAWSSLLTLIREGCALTPPAQFLLAAILHELMIKCCPIEERKDQKDLQDVTARLIECVSQVCGSCLEQTTWLRRNLAVKEQQESEVATPDSSIGTSGSASDVFVNSSHSVHAQLVLSEILAPILDICFGSSEKDKVNTILTSLMYNIVPYLKTHTIRNMPSFNACSKLLASLSSYQYTRKAWKKDVFDLLMDNSLFQMDHSCLKFWRVIVDNLMTHDNTTFRDLMSRVSLTQSGGLNIFSSKEQECEQKAQLLKRLAYVIFCSEMDQYAKYMPDIQEQLTSNLRLSVPTVQAEVFSCFRVILLRMSPLHVTSLWPIIISEMLQVFLQIEQELTTDTEKFNQHIKLMSTLDASWATNSSNGLHALGHPHWLKLQLATAKLLDLSLLLPAVSLPQFQMYRWAFVGDVLSTHHKQHQQPSLLAFTPHVVRIANLMDQKFQVDTPIETLPMKHNELLLPMSQISQLKELHSFFKTLSLCSNRHRTECGGGGVGGGGASQSDYNDRQYDKKLDLVLEKIDKVIEMDFLDRIPR